MPAPRERALRESAIGACHDMLSPDDLREANGAFGHELRMLDDIFQR